MKNESFCYCPFSCHYLQFLQINRLWQRFISVTTKNRVGWDSSVFLWWKYMSTPASFWSWIFFKLMYSLLLMIIFRYIILITFTYIWRWHYLHKCCSLTHTLPLINKAKINVLFSLMSKIISHPCDGIHWIFHVPRLIFHAYDFKWKDTQQF